MSDYIRCVAIDDEPLALEVIDKFCQRIGNIELRKFSNPATGLQAIEQSRPDIVFLDIEMDGLTGLDIASRLPRDTCFIFTTAYLRYAVNGFDLDAVDYLHKPFAYSRFQIAFTKALRRIGREKIQTAPQSIVVKQEYNNISISLDDILYIEAIEAYSKIFRVTGDCVMSSLCNVSYPLEKHIRNVTVRVISADTQIFYRVKIQNQKFLQTGDYSQ